MAPPLCILLVEDDDVDREFMSRLIGNFGRPISLSEAGSLAEARECLSQRHFDCVLLDYHLRGDLGLELVPDVSKHRSEICPIILVTLSENKSLIVEAMRQGVSDYIAKASLSIEKLRAIVGRAVTRAEAEQAQRETRARLLERTEKLRRENEETLLRAAEEAQRTARAKSMFVANMSHEIRTPLNAVIGLSYLLQRTPLSREQSELVDRIKLASKSLLEIVNNVLDLSKLGASALRLESIPFNLRLTLEDLIDLIDVQVGQKNLKLELDIADEIPAAVTGDPVRLHQVLGNLLTNAVKFTHEGSVRLRAKLVRNVACLARIRFEVEDTGIGIAPETLTQLFKPFAQGEASTTRRFGGTGLGLSIARELVILMGGEIGVDGRPGEGCTFWVEAEFNEAEEPTAASTPKPIVPGAPRLNRVRALLVDDSEVNLEVGKSILESEGALVQTACDGQKAVRMVLAEPKAFDIILMDLQMPVLDGHDAFRRIAAVLGAERPVVVALTAGSLTDASDDVGASGMDGLMHKPFDVDDLVDWIRDHVGLTETVGRAKKGSQSSAWPEVAGIESSLARAQMGDNRALFKAALKTFARQYDGLESLLGVDDVNETKRIMHRLKGGAATVGAQSLRELALQTEAACKADDAPALAAALQRVCEQFDYLRGNIREFLSENEAKSAA